MNSQTQYEPKRSDFLENEPTETKSAPAGRQKQKTGRKPIYYLIVPLLCLVCFFGGVTLRNKVAADPFTAQPDAGYLPLSEYVLRDLNTGEPVQEESLSGFTDAYTYNFSYNAYETARGIAPGATWEEFVDAYGDTYIYMVFADNIPIDTEGPITVQEFHDQFVKTGVVNPAESEIDINFMTGTDGKNLYYTDTQMVRASDHYDRQPDILKPVFSKNDRPSRFQFHFGFLPEDGGTLDFIYSSRNPQY